LLNGKFPTKLRAVSGIERKQDSLRYPDTSKIKSALAETLTHGFFKSESRQFKLKSELTILIRCYRSKALTAQIKTV